MRCSLCSHPKRAAIEAAAKTASIADVAEKFGVNESALGRHVSTAHPRAVAKPVKRGASASASPATKPVKRGASASASPATRPRATSSSTRPPVRTAPADAVHAPVPAQRDDEPPATSRSPATPATARANAHRIADTIDKLLDSARNDVLASYQDVASLARAALSANRQLAQLTGEWGASESTVASSPHFKRLMNVILDALRGEAFAGARSAIIEALAREEQGGARAVAA